MNNLNIYINKKYFKHLMVDNNNLEILVLITYYTNSRVL